MNDPEGSALSRKQLQEALKARGLGAVGSTQALRSAYDQARLSGNASPAAAVASESYSSPHDRKPAATTSSPKKSKEKRLSKLRTTISLQTRARIDRAKTQRLYLIQRGEITNGIECTFVVLGSTGNVYTVHVCKLPTCTCPDHQKGHLCKHILFVFLKVMGLDADSHVIYQAALLESELKEMFACMTARQTGGVMLANEQVRATYVASLKQTPDDSGSSDGGVQRKTLEGAMDCPICFDEMDQMGTLTFCRAMCGTNFHEDCIRRWLQQHTSHPTCPNCRQPWQGENQSPSMEKEGYTNLGQLQGLSPQRDTSTYSRWYGGSSGGSGNKRRRRWY